MSKRTQIVCIHEGKEGASIDPVFANSFLKAYGASWSRSVRFSAKGGKTELLASFPQELKACISAGAKTTLFVLADLDDDNDSGDELKKKYESAALNAGISQSDIDDVVFIFSKDRIENWIEYLVKGSTDESKEGPRENDYSVVRNAAKSLAKKCLSGKPDSSLPPSLQWSCANWHGFVQRMR